MKKPNLNECSIELLEIVRANSDAVWATYVVTKGVDNIFPVNGGILVFKSGDNLAVKKESDGTLCLKTYRGDMPPLWVQWQLHEEVIHLPGSLNELYMKP